MTGGPKSPGPPVIDGGLTASRTRRRPPRSVVSSHRAARPLDGSAMIDLDGSFGEGGGQILRSSLTLALLTGQAFRLRNVRARRARPGLQPQHLTAVRAAAEVGRARTRGASVGSGQLDFEPGAVQPG